MQARLQQTHEEGLLAGWCLSAGVDGADELEELEEEEERDVSSVCQSVCQPA